MEWTPSPMHAAVDICAFTIVAGELHVLLVKRGEAPYWGMWALPGGYLNNDETAEQAAYRELDEETGIPRSRLHLEPVAFYTEPGRDPRGRVVSFSYLALIPAPPPVAAGGDADETRWTPVRGILDKSLWVAFDHLNLITDAVDRARSRLEHTTVGVAFCPPEFTITELRRVYEAVWGGPLDVRNFSRKVTGIDGFLEPTGEKTTRDGGRPAALYRAGSASRLQPPMYRPAERDRPASSRRSGSDDPAASLATVPGSC